MELLNKAKRVGIMGGAFDPIHYGHLTAAECVRCEMGLDIVLFIPTGRPPHKDTITFSEHRYLMTVLATADNPYFHTSRMELDRPGPSYTVDTLRMLKDMTDAELFFIVGADEMLQISTWKDADALPDLCRWVPVTRPGYSIKEALEIPGLDISGTALRRRINTGKPIKYLITSDVEKYIRDSDLYQNHNVCDIEIHKAVAGQLSERRYRHTLGVIETAILLAARHGVNLRKAYLAALLHDYAKEFKEDEKRALCKKFAIPLDPIQDQYVNLVHGQLGAEFARRSFNIDDPDILEAIIYHTTGRAGMGPLEQIIKIADNIEPNRPDYPELEIIRNLSMVDLSSAAAASIKKDIRYTESKGHIIHPWGKEALEDLER